jgi:anti-sigma B factor antagonist
MPLSGRSQTHDAPSESGRSTFATRLALSLLALSRPGTCRGMSNGCSISCGGRATTRDRARGRNGCEALSAGASLVPGQDPEVNSADSCHSGRDTTPWGAGVNLDVAITVGRRRSEVVAKVAGELDAYTAPKLHHLLTDLIDDQGNLFVDVDLSGVEFLDSAALHVLVAHRRSLERRGGAFTLAGVPPIVHRILRAAGEADTFSIRPPEA